MHKKTMPQRILALLLCVLLTAGMLSLSVFAEESSPFQGTSVSLGSELLVNFYAQVADTQGAVMSFTVNGSVQTVPVTQACRIEGDIYRFSCTLAPAQMTETVQAVLTDSGRSYTASTSVKAYAEKLFAGKRWDLLAAAGMMRATLNYGAAAQSYFGYRLEDMANAGQATAPTGKVPAAESTALVSGTVSGLQFYGASLVFHSRVAVRFYFSGSVEGIRFQAGEQEYTPVEKNGVYYVEIGGIDPQDYGTDIALTASAAGEALTVTYSPMCYISRMYGKTENGELKALMAQMYDYHRAALSYLEDPYGNTRDNLVSAQ